MSTELIMIQYGKETIFKYSVDPAPRLSDSLIFLPLTNSSVSKAYSSACKFLRPAQPTFRPLNAYYSDQSALKGYSNNQ